MKLDEQDYRNGLKFIVGTWQPEYVINMFSADLARIPVSEFSSADGLQFSAIEFTFSEDHTVLMKNAANGREVSGTWEQRSYGEFHYTLNGFLTLPAGTNESVAETLRMQDGKNLVVSLGVISIVLKKVAEGTITEEDKKDIGDLPCDETMTDIVGMYAVEKMRTYTDAGFAWITKEVQQALSEENDTLDADDYILQMFGWKVEFTDDHKVIVWMVIPEGTSQADLKAALGAGEIADVRGGMFCEKPKEWKAVDGRYYYNTEEHREVFGEEQSPWEELKYDEVGNLFFLNNTMLLRKL